MPTKTTMTEEEIYKEAKKRVEEKKGFRTHFIVYLCVNALLVIIWATTGAGFPWFVFPLGGWGIGILFHFLGVYAFSREVDKREIEKEAKKNKEAPGLKHIFVDSILPPLTEVQLTGSLRGDRVI